MDICDVIEHMVWGRHGKCLKMRLMVSFMGLGTLLKECCGITRLNRCYTESHY